MINGDTAFELKQLQQLVKDQNALITKLSSMVDPKNEMWDDQDMIQNWKVSKRLLAEWRKENVIGYVQYKNKIWYSRDAREAFIARHMVKSREEGYNEYN